MKSLNDLVGAGFDTLMNWLILYMIVFPEVQKRVHEEIDAVIGSSRRIEIADRSRLNFTWATILEVMRITTMVPFALPHSTVADTEINGFGVDKKLCCNDKSSLDSYGRRVLERPEDFPT